MRRTTVLVSRAAGLACLLCLSALNLRSANAAGLIYVAGDEGVSVIDGAANVVIDTYEVGSVAGMTLTADGLWLYAGRLSEQPPFEVAVIDASSGRVARTFAVPGLAYDLSLSPDERRLWVSHSVRCGGTGCVGDTGISVVDPASGEPIARIAGQSGEALLGRVAIDPSGATGYAANTLGIVAIDTASLAVVADRPTICCVSRVLALHPDGHSVYILGNEFGGFVGIADLRLATDFARPVFVMGQAPAEIDFQIDIVFSPDGRRAYLPGSIGDAGVLFVLDTVDPAGPVLERAIDLAAISTSAAVTTEGDRVYLMQSDDSIAVLETDTFTQVATIEVSTQPFGRIVVGRGEAVPRPTSGGGGGGCALTNTAAPSQGVVPVVAGIAALIMSIARRRGACRLP